MLMKVLLCQAEACPLTWETSGGVAARKALIGTATSTFGPVARELTKGMQINHEEPAKSLGWACWEGLIKKELTFLG